MLHPSEFFKWVAIRIGIDVFEIFDEELRKKLMNVHPRNFIKSKITHPVYRIKVSYETDRGNYKESEKYMILDSPGEAEYDDFWAEMFVKDYEEMYQKTIKNLKVLHIDYVGDAVLQIG